MNTQDHDSAIKEIERKLTIALALYFLLVILIFCATLSHPPLTDRCHPQMNAFWYQPDCRSSR